jgi:hypothetical protein
VWRRALWARAFAVVALVGSLLVAVGPPRATLPAGSYWLGYWFADTNTNLATTNTSNGSYSLNATYD